MLVLHGQLDILIFCANKTVQDWEIIEPASFDQLGRNSAAVMAEGKREERREEEEEEEGRESPQVVPPRERWRRAIEQQIMLQRMEKENQSIMSKSLLINTLTPFILLYTHAEASTGGGHKEVETVLSGSQD